MDRHFITEPKYTDEQLLAFKEAWLTKFKANRGPIKTVPNPQERPNQPDYPIQLPTGSVEEKIDNYIGTRAKGEKQRFEKWFDAFTGWHRWSILSSLMA